MKLVLIFLFRLRHRALHDWPDGNWEVKFRLWQRQEARMSGQRSGSLPTFNCNPRHLA